MARHVGTLVQDADALDHVVLDPVIDDMVLGPAAAPFGGKIVLGMTQIRVGQKVAQRPIERRLIAVGLFLSQVSSM